MPPARPLVAVIHANPATMGPVAAGFADGFPDADLWHLLDDRLVKEADAAGGLTPALRSRMTALIEYAVRGGARAVQLACSMYGPVASAARQPVPVLASDQALFDEVVAGRPGKVVIVASLHPAAVDSAERLTAALAVAGLEAHIEPVVVEEAFTASQQGDVDRVGALLSAAAARHAVGADVVVLAQYSLAPAVGVVAAAVDVPVLSGPHLAAAALATAVRPA
jgi:aspartate/glutamate racemase